MVKRNLNHTYKEYKMISLLSYITQILLRYGEFLQKLSMHIQANVNTNLFQKLENTVTLFYSLPFHSLEHIVETLHVSSCLTI